MQLRVKYIHLGSKKTGGFVHQQIFFESLVKELAVLHTINSEVCSIPGKFIGLLAWFRLLLIGYQKSDADIVIVPARLALGSVIRAFFRKKHVFVVLHNYDLQTWQMKLYFKTLFACINAIGKKRTSVICISKNWENLFKKKVKCGVFVFPNLFHVSDYLNYKQVVKKRQLYFGLYSSKQDLKAYEKLNNIVKELGYNCLFTVPEEVQMTTVETEIQILQVSTSEYLQTLAESEYTIALPIVLEGWGRVAHESILVRTPVIGYSVGGQKELLTESNSLMVDSVDEIVEMLKNSTTKPINLDFVGKYDIQKSQEYIRFILKKIDINK